MNDIIFNRIVENAIDFLEVSVELLETKPKYSIINFCSSIELFLKARLAAEHWSLIVTSKQLPDYNKVKTGEFQSVNLSEAVEKLKKTVQSGLNEDELRSFKSIFAHRNKAVHFYHEAHTTEESNQEKIQSIVKQQLNAWYYLYSIITSRWLDVFKDKIDDIETVNKKLKANHEFLRIVYDKIKLMIQEEITSGVLYTDCPSCSYESLKHESNNEDQFYNVFCKVCDFTEVVFHSKCTDCNHDIFFIGEGYTTCSNCEGKYSPDFISEKIYDGPCSHDEDSSLDDIHCEECWENDSVVRTSDNNYRCTNCFEVYDDIFQCEWCGTYGTVYYEYSYLNGCSACEGRSGWKDD